MQKTLVEIYEILRHVHIKRKNIQRKNIFSKSVFGYSIQRLAKNDVIERLDIYTDNTTKISNISVINDDVLNTLNKSGYYYLSDIALVDKSILQKETNLPDNAISELHTMATKEYDIPYLEDGNVIEKRNKKDVIKSLIKSNWKILILFEYSMLNWLRNKTKDIYMKSNIGSKNELILTFKNRIDKPKNYYEAIAFCTNSSEKYVKDVISGRIENSLTKKEREDILNRDGNSCRACSNDDNLEIHHIIPVANGGGKYPKNLCTLCSNCHFNIAHGENTSTISYNSQKEFWDNIIGETP